MRVRPFFPGLFVVLATTAGCPDLPAPILCGEIPSGGCPAGRGGSCDDATCSGLYDCVDGRWVNTVVCPRPDGGTGAGAGSAGTGGGLPDAGPCTPVTINTTGETTDCTPDLENPDCPVEVAETCAEQACLTGCVDFFLCTKSGWTDVAYCTDDGKLIVTQ